MANYTSEQVFQTVQKTGLMPLFYHPDIEVCKNVIKACYDGGARVFEFTNRGENASELFESLRHYVTAELPEMKLGIGTVMDVETAEKFIALGADFIVCPIMKTDVAAVCAKHKILWAPGCGTLTEMVTATEHGAKVVKMFPAAEIGGPGFVKAAKAPCPWLQIMPTGGVSPDEENLRAWFEAGVICVGMGSKLIQTDDMHPLTEKVATTLELISRIRD
ncbi:MAG: bifunctional 4-hydroxy-2-oxoglutarate aldolase/2-dehydro-3-deoxy-phosphogluconate aldolase [Flavobacteriales bacterium]|nr:bifunctional 4-hydroxy-2-oxoglutarate aldolase/2-dehydro-3-deoxy-phosphogluconate aldolase [Flavobacteriales bacterium]